MKKTIYRNIALILALTTIISVLAACKQTGETDETKYSVRTDGTTGTTPLTSSDVDPIPDDLKFTGRDFVIAAPAGNSPTFFWQETDSGFELYFDSEKLVDLIDKVGGVLTDKQYVWLEAGMNTDTNIFFEDRALFIQSDFTYCEAWRNQKSDFGILPLPKADEKQEKYLTYSDQWGLALAMPKTAKDPDRTGAILEMMAQLSYELIRPAYYEKTLMGKYRRDDESEEMLNIIFDGITYEPGITFITNLAWLPFRDCVVNNKNLASWYAGYRNQIEQNFTELFDSVKERTE